MEYHILQPSGIRFIIIDLKCFFDETMGMPEERVGSLQQRRNQGVTVYLNLFVLEVFEFFKELLRCILHENYAVGHDKVQSLLNVHVWDAIERFESLLEATYFDKLFVQKFTANKILSKGPLTHSFKITMFFKPFHDCRLMQNTLIGLQIVYQFLLF